jgi:hypothetical protein
MFRVNGRNFTHLCKLWPDQLREVLLLLTLSNRHSTLEHIVCAVSIKRVAKRIATLDTHLRIDPSS